MNRHLTSGPTANPGLSRFLEGGQDRLVQDRLVTVLLRGF